MRLALLPVYIPSALSPDISRHSAVRRGLFPRFQEARTQPNDQKIFDRRKPACIPVITASGGFSEGCAPSCSWRHVNSVIISWTPHCPMAVPSHVTRVPIDPSAARWHTSSIERHAVLWFRARFRKLHDNGPKPSGRLIDWARRAPWVGRFDELSARLQLVDGKLPALPAQFLIAPRCSWSVQAAAHLDGYKA
jgi:hypothetical protein